MPLVFFLYANFVLYFEIILFFSVINVIVEMECGKYVYYNSHHY